MDSFRPRYEYLHEHQLKKQENGETEEDVKQQFQLPNWLIASSVITCVVLVVIIRVVAGWLFISLQTSSAPEITPPPPPPPRNACANSSALRCDYEALVSFKQSISDDLSNWTGNDPCDDWMGVICSEIINGNKRVTGLNLAKKQYVYDSKDKVWVLQDNKRVDWNCLTGTVDLSLLSNMPFMQSLSLGECMLIQQLPCELSSLSNLSVFDFQGFSSFNITLPVQFSTWTQIQLFVLQPVTGSFPKVFSTWRELQFVKFNQDGYLSLKGTLPPELSKWISARSIDFGLNQFTGYFPPEYSTWRKLQQGLFSGDLTGTLPPELSTWTSAHEIHFDGNKFSGSFPPEYSTWHELQYGWFNSVGLRGTLPPELSAWTSAQQIAFDVNSFSGSFPPEYSTWHELYYGTFDSGGLRGTLPPQLSTWTSAQFIDFSDNNFSGSFPPEYSTWLELQQGFFYSCLTGTLPSELSTWTSVDSIDFSANNFSGSFPPEYSTWCLLNYGWFDSGGLRGTLPPELSTWTSAQQINFDGNFFSGSVPPQYTAWLDSLQIFFVKNQFNDLPCATLATQIAFESKLEVDNDIIDLKTCLQKIYMKEALDDVAVV